MTSRYTTLPCIVIGLLSPGVGACQRTDTLAALPSPNGEMLLIDTAVGTNDRFVCISRTLSDSCSSRNSDLFVADLINLDDLRVNWEDDNTARVEVDSGRVVRYNSRSKHGVKLRLVRSQPSEASPR